MSKQLDPRAFWNISYGLYIVSSCCDGKLNGQISNSVIQVTDSPAMILSCMNKTELTHEYISKSGHFSISVLEEDTPMKLIGLFGFKSGRDVDKLSQVEYKEGLTGCPMVTTNAVAILEAKVVQTVDVGTHTLFIGEVVYSELLKQARPMTYAYYHQVKKGKEPDTSPISKAKEGQILPEVPVSSTAPVASVYEKGKVEMKKYVCDVCGYVYDPATGDPDAGIAPGTAFENLPEDWVCPICGVGKEEFSPA